MTNKLSVNRLQLDFKLELRSERTAFIDEYLKKILFKPTEEELDLMAKYILWGKEKTEDKGKAARLRHEGFELETRYATWATTPAESLDALFESPSFSEASISNIPLKFIKPEFSREDARLNAPPYLQPTFENLWRQIDELDLLLTYYDLSHSKRTAPPSPSLLSRIPRETQLYLESQSHHQALTPTQNAAMNSLNFVASNLHCATPIANRSWTTPQLFIRSQSLKLLASKSPFIPLASPGKVTSTPNSSIPKECRRPQILMKRSFHKFH